MTTSRAERLLSSPLLPELWDRIAQATDTAAAVLAMSRTCLAMYVGIGGPAGAFPLIMERLLPTGDIQLLRALPLQLTVLSPHRRGLLPRPSIFSLPWPLPLGVKMVAGGAAHSFVLRWLRNMGFPCAPALTLEYGDVDLWRRYHLPPSDEWPTELDGHRVDAPCVSSHMGPCRYGSRCPFDRKQWFLNSGCTPMQCFDLSCTQWAIDATNLIWCTPIALYSMMTGVLYGTHDCPAKHEALNGDVLVDTGFLPWHWRIARRLIKYQRRGYGIAEHALFFCECPRANLANNRLMDAIALLSPYVERADKAMVGRPALGNADYMEDPTVEEARIPY